MKKRTRVVVAFALLATGIALLAAGGVDGWLAFYSKGANPFRNVQGTPERLRETETRGDEVCAALERWHAAHGTYPANLGMLVPSELASIQTPVVGMGRWEYTLLPDGRFRLGYWIGPFYQRGWRDAGSREWGIDL